ncbi:hypothetical protein J6O48_14055 [bacterium]|nr:hypothetical protein [bacterium]
MKYDKKLAVDGVILPENYIDIFNGCVPNYLKAEPYHLKYCELIWNDLS